MDKYHRQLILVCLFLVFFTSSKRFKSKVKAYGQVPETIPDEDACTSALNLLQMVKEKRMKENKKKKVR